MKQKRIFALVLAAVVTMGAVTPACAVTIPATCDETYYATLDYYGQMQEGSVVKSYRLNGASTVTDRGSYDEVVNLTNSLSPTITGNTVTFTLGEDAPEKFYFEGKTSKPFEALPWKLNVSYKLNGAPTLAEDLAGKTGLIEIDLDVTRNPAASEYSRTNLVLTAAAAFNDDDITSLEAPGAEMQMIGNLRTVLFMVLPGEEQHFVIQVGSEDFSFSGLILLAVPATLQQLEQVKDLKEAKEEAEDSLDTVSQSLDAILDSLDGMSGSLSATAAGLDRLNAARGTVSARKDDIYAATDGLHDLEAARASVSAGKDGLSASADLALDSLEDLSASLAALDRYGDLVTAALDDTVDTLNDMNSTLQGLSEHLKTTRELVERLQADTKKLSEILDEGASHSDEVIRVLDDLTWVADYLEADADDLMSDMDALERALRLTTGLSPLSQDDLLGFLSTQEQAQMKEVLTLRKNYEAYLKQQGLTQDVLSFADFIVAGAYQQFCEQTVKDAVEANVPTAVEQAVTQFAQANGRAPSDEELAAIQAQVVENVTTAAKGQLPTLEQFTQAPAAQPYVEQAQAAQAAYEQFAAQLPIIDAANVKIREVNQVLTNITGPTARVVDALNDLCQDATAAGVQDDLSTTVDVLRDLAQAVKNREGTGRDILKQLDGSGDVLTQLTKSGDALLGQVDTLVGLVNDNRDDTKQAVKDVERMSTALQTTLNTTAAALRQAKDILDAAGPDLNVGAEKTLGGLSSAADAVRSAGPDLDAGTRATLSNLAGALRQSTVALGQSDSIRSAKSSIHDIISDEWEKHTGEVDGLLNIDAAADPVSMTDSRNPTPGSIQYVMRTQEIKKSDEAEEDLAATEKPSTTFWDRIVAMFRGLWEDVKFILRT